MATLDEEAKKAGVIMLNECGVDPGALIACALRWLLLGLAALRV